MNTELLGNWFRSLETGRTLKGRFLSPLVAFLVATAGLSSLVPGGLVLRGFEATTDTAPLEVAGHPTVGVVGYVDLGQHHLYVTAESLLIVGIATAIVAYGGRARHTLAGITLGIGATGGLALVTGCPCGAGSALSLWQLVG